MTSDIALLARSHPAFVCAVIWLALVPFSRRLGQIPARVTRPALLASGIVILIAYTAIAVWYASQVAYFDRAEPTITAVSSIFSDGQPLYPSLEAPARYVHVYGPMLFVAQSVGMFALGHTVVASKFVGALAGLAGVFGIFLLLHRRAGVATAFFITGVGGLVYLGFGNTTFWIRPDPLLILCVVLGLLSLNLASPIAAAVALGIAAGVAIDLKVSAPAYFIPAFVLLHSRAGRWPLVIAATTAAVVALAPFGLSTVSLSHYVDYLRLSAANGVGMATLRQNLEWALFLWVPVAVVMGGRDRLLASTAASILLACVIGAKPGGGAFHLLPCIPLLAYAIAGVSPSAWSSGSLRALGMAFCLTASIVAVPRQASLIETTRGRDLRSVVIDLARFHVEHPGRTIEVGYAGISYVSDARPALVFRTHSYLIDAPAVQEYRLAGLDLPQSTLQVLADCRVEYWLVPSGAPPFLVPSAYQPAGPPTVFDDAFRQAFLRNYRQTGTTSYFDVWECRRRAN